MPIASLMNQTAAFFLPLATMTMVCSAVMTRGCSAEEPAAAEERSIPNLIKDLESDDFDARELAHAQLLNRGATAKAALEAAAKNGSVDFQSRAVEICELLSLSDKLCELYPRIKDELQRKKSCWVEYFFRATYNQALSPDDLQALGAGALRRMRGLDKATVAHIFVRIVDAKLEHLAPDLIVCLKHDSEEVREYAVGALCALRVKEAIPGVIARLKDEKESVREKAVFALRDLHAIEAVPSLIESLNDRSENVVAAAALSLGAMDAREAIPALIARLRADSSSQAYSACTVVAALGILQAREAIPDLVESLTHKVSSVRRNAAIALGPGREGGHSETACVPQRRRRVCAERRRKGAQTIASPANDSSNRCAVEGWFIRSAPQRVGCPGRIFCK
jgi:hypothetical protein